MPETGVFARSLALIPAEPGKDANVESDMRL